jgi:hypothetical protein
VYYEDSSPRRLTLASCRPDAQVKKFINERPVRKFNYQTPNALFLQKLKGALIILMAEEGRVQPLYSTTGKKGI